ncbi:dehydrogenase [Bacillus thuringiensis serovar galleriae]|nr:dehydrogenase [Bacillus thuringiensis serovar amagiensis]OTY66634.1 dehydrogenase [Bacillus thuringiensis serovar azorensis]OTY86065.1 dehydrogenase [Bacillus thuringiensis serovar galleriae]OTZ54235.1 dehydrogenase [Bacillus thuringiensis serovar wuhanensis]
MILNILKVGIIGCGSIAQHRHLPEYEANPYVQIVAVCDSNKKRAKEIANKYGVNMYTDYNELINYEELDAVSVCTPNHLHAAISIAALQAGIHVLCEKPIATSKADAEMMIGAAEKSGKKLMIGHNQRFVASHQKAKQLIKSGAIGKIYSFRTAFGHSGPENWSVDGKESWFFKKEEAFLGAMGDLGVHKADLIRYILNEEITEVGAFVETSAKTFSNVDDCAVCILKSESGIIGTLAASWSYVSKEDNSTIIYGEKATLRLEDDPTNSLIIQYKNGEVVKYELNKIQSNATVGQSNSHVIEQFVDSVLSNKEPLINGVEGMKSLEVILAAIQSSETKQVVTIPL